MAIYSQMALLSITEPPLSVVCASILISKTINYLVNSKFYFKGVKSQADLTSLALITYLCFYRPHPTPLTLTN